MAKQQPNPPPRQLILSTPPTRPTQPSTQQTSASSTPISQQTASDPSQTPVPLAQQPNPQALVSNLGTFDDQDLSGTEFLTFITPEINTELNQSQIDQPSKPVPITAPEFENFIDKLKNLPNPPCSRQTAFTGFALIMQQGGHQKQVKTRNVVVNGTQITKAQIQNALQIAEIKHTPRQISRTFGKDIAMVGATFGVPGHLSKQFLTEIPNPTNPLSTFWACDFQVDHPSCPPEVSEFLRKRNQERQNSKTK